MTVTLADATSAESAARRTLLVPVGSLEQHGPHLPLNTDTLIAEAVATGAAELLDREEIRTWVAPPLAFGSSGEHQSFPGTVSIGTEALTTVLIELVRSARTWADRVVFVNAHGGNVQALTRAVTQLRREGHEVEWLPCRTEEVDLHAGRTETSLLLHLRPDAVRPDRAAAGDTRPLEEILPMLIAGGVAAVSANGVLGDPSGASAQEGATMLRAMVEEIANPVRDRGREIV